MRKRLFYIISEVALIALSATLGTFLWNHGSPIFNSGQIWRSFLMDIVQFWPAYLTMAIVLVALVVVLYYRAKGDDECATKKDIQDLRTDIHSQTKILQEILEVLKRK